MHLRILPIVILLVANSAFAFIPDSSEASEGDFYGLIEREIDNDTLYIDYHLTPYDFEPDSVALDVFGFSDVIKYDVTGFDDSIRYVTIYRALEGVPYETDWRIVKECGERLCLEGNIKIPLDGQEIYGWVISATGYSTDSAGVVTITESDEYVSPGYFGFGMEFVFPSFGYLESRLAEPLNKRGPFLGIGLSMYGGNQHHDITISTSWSGLGKNYKFAEPFRLGYKYYTGTRQNFMPSFYGAFKLSKIKFRDNETEYYKLRWGFEGGIAFEGSFERIGYKYSTALGGYHTYELFLVYSSGFSTKVGTSYQMLKAKDFWMLRASIQIEGWSSLVGDRWFSIENKRPLPHKFLALVGFLPMAPLAGIAWIIEKIPRRDFNKK